MTGGRIVLANKLVRARQGLSLPAKRLLTLVLAKVDQKRLQRKLIRRTVTALEFAEAYSITPSHAYQQLKEAADHLFRAEVETFEAAERRKAGQRPEDCAVRWRWVATVRSMEGSVEVSLNPELGTLISGLRGHYTQCDESVWETKRAWRLYELLQRYRSSGWAEYTREDLEAALEVPESYRRDWARMRVKILELAVAQVAAKFPGLTWGPKMQGRKVVAVRFEWDRKGGEIEE